VKEGREGQEAEEAAEEGALEASAERVSPEEEEARAREIGQSALRESEALALEGQEARSPVEIQQDQEVPAASPSPKGYQEEPEEQAMAEMAQAGVEEPDFSSAQAEREVLMALGVEQADQEAVEEA